MPVYAKTPFRLGTGEHSNKPSFRQKPQSGVLGPRHPLPVSPPDPTYPVIPAKAGIHELLNPAGSP